MNWFRRWKETASIKKSTDASFGSGRPGTERGRSGSGRLLREAFVTSENKDLVARYQTLVKYSKMSVTYAFGDSREVLDSTTIRSWMTVSESGEASFSDEQIEDYVAGLAEKYDTLEKMWPLRQLWERRSR